MKIITVVGARPQFIKAAILSRVISKYDEVQEVLVHTGQHYDVNMSKVFFEEMNIPEPNYNLGIGSGTHGVQTGRMLSAIENVLFKERPDVVIVYGDTNSTLAGALSAVKLHIPVAHIEAGLRSYNRKMAEEINRVLADHSSDLLFAPTKNAFNNLINEGFNKNQCYLVGDVMYDAVLFYGNKAKEKSTKLKEFGLASKEYILATIHRAENTDGKDNLSAIINGLISVSRDIPVILPLHPRTKNALVRHELFEKLIASSIMITEPVGYLDMLMLTNNALLIATDSGGLQKEAYFFKVPCITLREETEWIELVNAGWNKVVNPKNSDIIERSIRSFIDYEGEYHEELYGLGDAAERIFKIVINAI